jgi:hypothetical protein
MSPISLVPSIILANSIFSVWIPVLTNLQIILATLLNRNPDGIPQIEAVTRMQMCFLMRYVYLLDKY